MSRFLKLFKRKDGATAVEYGLIAAIISAALVAGLVPLGNSIKANFGTVVNSLQDGD